MSQSALVTGGTGGIGSAIVRRLRANGYEVVFCGRDERRAAALERETGAVFFRADATDRVAVDASVAFALERLGRVDLFVGNAGVLAEGPLASTTDEELELLVQTNLTSTFRYGRALFAPMRVQGSGVMVLIASDSAIRGSHRIPAYSVVKAGVVTLAELFGAEGAPYGIRANAVCPGNTLPGMAGDDPAGWRATASGAFATAGRRRRSSRVPGVARRGAHQRRDAAHRRRHGRRPSDGDARLRAQAEGGGAAGGAGGFLVVVALLTASRAIVLGFAERSVSATSSSGLFSPRPWSNSCLNDVMPSLASRACLPAERAIPGSLDDPKTSRMITASTSRCIGFSRPMGAAYRADARLTKAGREGVCRGLLRWALCSPAMRTGADRTLELLAAQVGRPVSEVETPVAMVDLDRLEANLTDLQSYCDEHGIALWPHTKTHKSPEIGLRQLELGAGGLTVAKTGEAQVFQEAGAPRILVHYPPFGTDKWERLARIAAEGVDLTVAVDGLPAAEGLAAALERRGARATLLVEMDVGLHRTGQTTTAGALALAQALTRLPAVEVAGISCYPGHSRGDAATVRSRIEAVDELLRATRDAFTAAGLRCDRISGGSTPSRYLTHETCVNELRSGTYSLLDRVDGTLDRCALTVAVTVVSDAVPDQIVIDAGSKTLTSDDHPAGGHGAIVGLPDADLHTINEEHGYVNVSALAERPAVGDRLQVIPNHACGCVNLHDGLLAVRDGVVDHVILVAARGLVR